MKRHELGQHYLIDGNVVKKMVSAADVRSNELVLEIGTGRGILTSELARTCKRLEGYEVDPLNLSATARAVGAANVKLRLADVFRARPVFDVLVSSLPYSRSAEFIDWLSQRNYRRAVVLLQEDFVEKILSPPGSRDYRAVSVIAQISSDIRLGDKVGREAFSPQPKVDSRITTFLPKTRLLKSQLVSIKRLFALRRRTLASAFEETGFGRQAGVGWPSERVNQLTPSEVYQVICMDSGA